MTEETANTEKRSCEKNNGHTSNNLKCIHWLMSEFRDSGGQVRLSIGACTILQKIINGFRCMHIVFK